MPLFSLPFRIVSVVLFFFFFWLPHSWALLQFLFTLGSLFRHYNLNAFFLSICAFTLLYFMLGFSLLLLVWFSRHNGDRTFDYIRQNGKRRYILFLESSIIIVWHKIFNVITEEKKSCALEAKGIEFFPNITFLFVFLLSHWSSCAISDNTVNFVRGQF